MTWVGVHMMSTGTSWINSFSTGISSTNWQSCTASDVHILLQRQTDKGNYQQSTTFET